MLRRPARARRILAVVAISLAAALAIGWLALGWLDGPWGMLPGGRLVGPEADCAAAQWERFAAVREVELEVRPSRPRSVTTWSVVHEGAVHVPADFLGAWKRWPHQVLEDDRVRVRVGGRIFACRAERVDDPERIAALRRAAIEKYDLRPGARAERTEVWWFRLLPR